MEEQLAGTLGSESKLDLAASRQDLCWETGRGLILQHAAEVFGTAWRDFKSKMPLRVPIGGSRLKGSVSKISCINRTAPSSPHRRKFKEEGREEGRKEGREEDNKERRKQGRKGEKREGRKKTIRKEESKGRRKERRKEDNKGRRKLEREEEAPEGGREGGREEGRKEGRKEGRR
ncbi:hypothetical protein E2320_011977, partial [Naja naja]